VTLDATLGVRVIMTVRGRHASGGGCRAPAGGRGLRRAVVGSLEDLADRWNEVLPHLLAHAPVVLRAVILHTSYDAFEALADAATPPALASTPLAKRSYDLWHSALFTCAGADPAEVGHLAGNSVEVLPTFYVK
jgi:hypothetical protein